MPRLRFWAELHKRRYTNWDRSLSSLNHFSSDVWANFLSQRRVPGTFEGEMFFLWWTQVNKSHGEKFIMFFKYRFSCSNSSCSQKEITFPYKKDFSLANWERGDDSLLGCLSFFYVDVSRSELSRYFHFIIYAVNYVSVLMNLSFRLW